MRMLWSRSASLIKRTLTSWAIATTILRMVAAWASCGDEYWIRSSLVTPSMRRATSGPNFAFDLMEGHVGVLHRVVQEGGGQGRGVEPVVGQDLGDRHRVGDVGVAGLADLALVGHPGGGECCLRSAPSRRQENGADGRR